LLPGESERYFWARLGYQHSVYVDFKKDSHIVVLKGRKAVPNVHGSYATKFMVSPTNIENWSCTNHEEYRSYLGEYGIMHPKCPAGWALKPFPGLTIDTLVDGQKMVDIGYLHADKYMIWLYKCIPSFLPARHSWFCPVYFKELSEALATNYLSMNFEDGNNVALNSYLNGSLGLANDEVVVSKVFGQHSPGWPSTFKIGECGTWCPDDWPVLLPIADRLSQLAGVFLKHEEELIGNIGDDSISFVDYQDASLNALSRLIKGTVMHTSQAMKSNQNYKSIDDIVRYVFKTQTMVHVVMRMRFLEILRHIGLGLSYEVFIGFITWALSIETFDIHWSWFKKVKLLRLRRDIQSTILKAYDNAVFLSGHVYIGEQLVRCNDTCFKDLHGLALITGREWSQPLQKEIDDRCIRRRPMVMYDKRSKTDNEGTFMAHLIHSMVKLDTEVAHYKGFSNNTTYEDYIRFRAEKVSKGTQSEVKLVEHREKVQPITPSKLRYYGVTMNALVAKDESSITAGRIRIVITSGNKGLLAHIGSLANKKGIVVIGKRDTKLLLGGGDLLIGPYESVDGHPLYHIKTLDNVADIVVLAKEWPQFINEVRHAIVGSDDHTIRLNKRAAVEQLSDEELLLARDLNKWINVISYSQKNELGKTKGRMILACGLMVFLILDHSSDIYQGAVEEECKYSISSSDKVKSFKAHIKICYGKMDHQLEIYNCIDWSNFNIHHTLEAMALMYLVRNVRPGNTEMSEKVYRDWSFSNLWAAASIYGMVLGREGLDDMERRRIKQGLVSGWRDTYLVNQVCQIGYIHCAINQVYNCLGYMLAPSRFSLMKGDDYIGMGRALDQALLVGSCRTMNGDLRPDGQFFSPISGEFLRIMHGSEGMYGQLGRSIGSLITRPYTSQESLEPMEALRAMLSQISVCQRRGLSAEGADMLRVCAMVKRCQMLHKTKDEIRVLETIPAIMANTSTIQGGLELITGNLIPERNIDVLQNMKLKLPTMRKSAPMASMLSKGLATQNIIDRCASVLSGRIADSERALSRLKRHMLDGVHEHTKDSRAINYELNIQAAANAKYIKALKAKKGVNSLRIREQYGWSPHGIRNLNTRANRRIVTCAPMSGKSTYIRGKRGGFNKDLGIVYSNNGVDDTIEQLDGYHDGDYLIARTVGWPKEQADGKPWWDRPDVDDVAAEVFSRFIKILLRAKGDYTVLMVIPNKWLETQALTLGQMLCEDGNTLQLLGVSLSLEHFVGNLEMALVTGSRKRQPKDVNISMAYNKRMISACARRNIPCFSSFVDATSWTMATVPTIDAKYQFGLTEIIQNCVEHIFQLVSNNDREPIRGDHQIQSLIHNCNGSSLGSWEELVGTMYKPTEGVDYVTILRLIISSYSDDDKRERAASVIDSALARYGASVVNEILSYDGTSYRAIVDVFGTDLGPFINNEIYAQCSKYWDLHNRAIGFSEYMKIVSEHVSIVVYNIVSSSLEVNKFAHY